MKSILTSLAAATLFTVLANAQTPRYTVTDLGTLGGTFSDVAVITNNGIIVGRSSAKDGSLHAFLRQKGVVTDVGVPGLGGKNSIAWGANEKGQVVGQAETSTADPNGEDFCGFKAIGLPSFATAGTNCIPFLFQNGVMTALPTLGGNNGVANAINSQGQAVGMAENQLMDPSCPAPQVLQFEPVVWQNGKVQQLPTFPGDLNGIAFGINDIGQVAGTSGSCALFDPHSNTNIFPNHALLWQDGKLMDLGSLGGATGNIALAINNLGQVVGDSDVAGDLFFHAFLWTKEKGMQDLGVLPGDSYSSALALNNEGQVVGLSLDADFNLRAVLWEKGSPIDLNTLIAPKSGLVLQLAESVNSRGEILGFGLTTAGDTHAYLATPIIRTTASAGPRDVTVTTRQIMLDGTASTSSDAKPLTYFWSIPQGQGSPSAGILQGSTATPTIQFGSTRGVYSFQLTVTDSAGTSATDVVTVNYQGN